MSTTTEKWTIFGERLKTELERQEMSLRQFAEKAGLTLTTACRYVHSQRTPRATEILKAAKVLGVTCDYMLGLSDDPHKTRDGWAKAGFHELPSAQPEKRTDKCTETHACDLISRQATIDAILAVTGNSSVRELYEHVQEHELSDMWSGGVNAAIDIIIAVPSAQPDSKELSFTHKALDTVSRQAVIEAINKIFPADPMRNDYTQGITCGAALATEYIKQLPSAQPETHDKRTETHACDCIERQAAVDWMKNEWNGMVTSLFDGIKALPSAQPDLEEAYICGETEAEARFHSEIVRCKYCKHFEYDHPYIIQGVPVLGHEVCNAWGDGCKTDENGYCFLAERRTDE